MIMNIRCLDQGPPRREGSRVMGFESCESRVFQWGRREIRGHCGQMKQSKLQHHGLAHVNRASLPSFTWNTSQGPIKFLPTLRKMLGEQCFHHPYLTPIWEQLGNRWTGVGGPKTVCQVPRLTWRGTGRHPFDSDTEPDAQSRWMPAATLRSFPVLWFLEP